MKRESGWYWVMLGSEWVVMEWVSMNYTFHGGTPINSHGGEWFAAGNDEEYFDNDFTQIDERRIVRPEQEASV